ncbi:hypothetical protein L211DRAFT_717624 [Terfezia boudieri ATCC MYA-4762]|uniref:Uncharacterized protein n=1 Tax=Terfezia boudieri ATCC MYA-4762 TaxID=1051890 RepID=A0A3N4LXT8_9PEZI|nr:hypothetical protein L211DRAFT_717624 [Terfezia boudieri ATCC MYA-4762]
MNDPFTDHHEDLNSDAFNFGGAEWDAMISAPYDDDPGMNLSNERLKKDHSNQPPTNQYLSADSPQGYDPSSGVSSPGLSDHNMDTLSSTSLEDRNDFDNLINYDGEANVGGTDCLMPVKPDINSPDQMRSHIDDTGMNLYGNMDWSNNFDDTVVYTGIGGNPEQVSPNIWGSIQSPPEDLNSEFTPDSHATSPRIPETAPMSTPMSVITPPSDRQSVPPEAIMFHAGLFGGYLTPSSSIDQKVIRVKLVKEEKTDGMAVELDADDEGASRSRPGAGKGKRKSPMQEWDLTNDQIAQRRLQQASLENQHQMPQTIPLDTPGSRKKTLNLTKHLADQPFVQLPLPFSENDSNSPTSLSWPRTSTRLLFINCEFPIKSRVETQTTLRIIAQDLPEGVKRLHMPRHTISRPKQMLKDPHVPSPDTLELDCYVVCETAWRKCPERLVKDALRKACKEPTQPNPHNKLRRFDDEDEDKPSTRERGPSVVELSMSDPNNPLNGGEVWVCAGCMDREGKRSTRKKVKRPKEEQPWWELESRRIVLMNTMEMRDWMLLPKDQQVPMGNKELSGQQYHVDSPVRIACYCRHQHEKIGYRIIYTIKDWRGSLKPQPLPQTQPTTPQPEVKRRKRIGEPTTPDAAQYAISMPTTPGPLTSSVTQSPSYSLAMQMNPLNFNQQPGYPMLNQINQIMQSSQPTPNIRAAISSQSSLAPLTSTHSINSQTSVSQQSPLSNHTQLPFTPQQYQFNPSMFAPPVNMRLPPQEVHQFVGTGLRDHSPVTTQVLPNGQMQHSLHQTANQMIIQQQQQQQSGYTNSNTSTTTMPSHTQYQRPQQPPRSYITSVIPGEGPVTGGIPVCVLGANFTPETEVFFGTILAPLQKYMSDTCLVVTCPANKPGSVPVYTTMSTNTNPAETKVFRYIDNNEKMLMELALNVLGSKVAGGKFTAADLARMIIGNNIELRPSPSLGSGAGDTTNRQQLERNLLRILDLIDQDDSPHPARLDLPDKQTGHRMLHFACALGMQSFVSALLARHAEPNARDRNGNTPLHFASLFNYPDIVKRLLAGGSEPSYNNRSGLTASNLASSEAVKMEFRRHSLGSRHPSRSNSVSSRYSRHSSVDLSSMMGDEAELVHMSDEGDDLFDPGLYQRLSRRGSTVDLRELDEAPHAKPSRQPTFFEQLSQPNWQMFSNSFQNMRNIDMSNIGLPNAPTYQQLLEYFNRNVVENIPAAPGLPNYQGLWNRLNRNIPLPQDRGIPRGAPETDTNELPPPSYDEVVNDGEVLSSDSKATLDMLSMTREMGGEPSSTISVLPAMGEGSSSGVEITKKESDELVIRRGPSHITVTGKARKMDQMRRLVETGDGTGAREEGTDRMLYIFWVYLHSLI